MNSSDETQCLTIVELGCTDVNYLEYNVEANTDDGSYLTLIVEVVLMKHI